MELTKETLEQALTENNMSPFLVIGLIVGKKVLEGQNVLVGLNILNEIQIDSSNNGLIISDEIKNMSPIEIAEILLKRGFSDEEIIQKLKKISND